MNCPMRGRWKRLYRIDGYDIELTRGDSLTLRIDLKGRNLPEGTEAVFTVKKRMRDERSVLVKRCDASEEILTVALEAGETDIAPGTYVWDVRLRIPREDGSIEVVTPMEYAALTILGAVGTV